MLVDFEPVAGILGQIYKPEELWEKQETGVFVTHLNGHSEHFPGTEDATFTDRKYYGVCDDVDQIKQHYPDIVESDQQYVVCMTPIYHEDQEEEGGWRWHKWGPYIGNHKPQQEYLYDEVGIERVFVFHILEVK